MATVPVYRSTQVDPRPLAPVYNSGQGATVDAFGGAEARALGAAGQQVAAAGNDFATIALKQQIEDNEREAKRLDVAYSGKLREITYGTEQQPGYHALEGEAAIREYGKTTEAYEKARRDLLDSTKNQRVRELFGQASLVRKEAEMGAATKHLAVQREAANDATSSARVADAAANAAVRPSEWQQHIAIATAEVMSVAERKGFSPDVINAKLRETNSAVVSSAVKGALAREDFATAQKIYDGSAGKLTAAAEIQIGTSLRDASVTKIAQALRDRAMELHPGDLKAQMDFVRTNSEGKAQDEAMQKVYAFYNMDRAQDAERRALRAEQRSEISFAQGQADRIRREAEHEVDRAYTMQERERREATRNAYSTAEAHIRDGGELATLPPEVRDALDGNKLSVLKTYEIQVASGKPVVTRDWAAFAEDMRKSPDALAELDLAKARTMYGDQEFNQIKNLVVQAQQGKFDPNSPSSPTGFFLAEAGKLGLMEGEKSKQRGQLQSMFNEEIAKAEATNGRKKLSFQEMKDIFTGLTDDVYIRGAFSVLGIDTVDDKFYKVKVPDTVRAKALASGMKFTEADLVRAYIKSLQPKAPTPGSK